MDATTPDAQRKYSWQSDFSASSEFAEEDSFKCIVLGDVGVGKTTLFTRITSKGQNQLQRNNGTAPRTTVSVDVQRRNVLLSSGFRVKMVVWDTAGLEKLRSLTDSYYRETDAVLLVYDSSTKASIKNHLDELRFRFGNDRRNNGMVGRGGLSSDVFGFDLNVLVFLLANKIDLGEGFALTEGEVKDLSAMARVPVADYFRVSGLTGQGVEEAVRTIGQGLLTTRRRSSQTEPRAARKTDTIRVQAAKTQPSARKCPC